MFNIKEYEGKEEELIEKIDLEKEIIKEKEENNSLLSKKVVIRTVEKEEIKDYIVQLMAEIGSLMSNEIKCEVNIEGNYLKINLNAENNGIIIGKDGRTLKSIQYIINQIVRKEVGDTLKVRIDVGKYQAEKQKNLERDIRFIADDVLATKIGVKLDYMNSYERRIVHNIINEYEKLETESEGEEPNRHINIVYKEK